MLIILFSLFKTLPVSSSENEHGNGHHGKEDKNVGFLWVHTPKCGYLINGNGSYGQVKVFCVSQYLDHPILLLLSSLIRRSYGP